MSNNSYSWLEGFITTNEIPREAFYTVKDRMSGSDKSSFNIKVKTRKEPSAKGYTHYIEIVWKEDNEFKSKVIGNLKTMTYEPKGEGSNTERRTAISDDLPF